MSSEPIQKHCSHCNKNVSENENEIQNNPSNTFNPTINFNPVINFPSPITGEKGLLTEFDGSVIPSSELPNNGVIGTSPVTIGRATLHIDDPTDRVLLHATINWTFPSGLAFVNFTIQRNNTLIYTVQDSGSGGSHLPVTTSLTFLDKTPTLGEIKYELIASSSFDDIFINFTVPVVFTAAEIEANNPINP